MTLPLVRFEKISFSYTSSSALIPSISFTVKPKSFVGLLGRNGIGKTTLLKLMANLLKPKTGSRFLIETPFHKWSDRAFSREVSYIPSSLECLFPIKVKDLVMLGRAPHLKAFSHETPADEERVQECLSITETQKLKDHYFQTLSSGEKQRVLLAKALAQNPKLLLVDEITAHLDPTYQKTLLNLLKQVSQTQDITIFMVSHDKDQAQAYSDEIFVLEQDGLTIYDRNTIHE